MKTMVIKPNGECEEHDHQFDNDQITEAVGGWWDSIRLRDGFRAYVNDRGLLVPGFEPNVLGTIITYAAGYQPEFVLMGTMVLMRDEGHEPDFPEGAVAIIRHIKSQYNAKVEGTN